MKTLSLRLPSAALLVVFTLSACDRDDSDHESREPAAKPSAAARASGEFRGKKVDVKMISDSKGERYDPVEVRVERGDSLRFILASGVHNVHFPPEKNPPGLQYPPIGALLQLPGQMSSYLMDYPAGRYYFQCDIHVVLGMVGHVRVEEDGSSPLPNH